MNTEMKEVKEEAKKEIKKEKILITVVGIFAFGLELFVTNKILPSLIVGAMAVIILVFFKVLFSFAYVSGKRAEIEREKQREIEREKSKMS